MFKLIMIIIVGGNSLDQGAGVSQHEYQFRTLEQCQTVRNFYSKMPLTLLEVTPQDPKRLVTISAECFKE